LLSYNFFLLGYFRPTLYVTLLASLIAFQPAVQAKMYRWIDKDGHIYYSELIPVVAE
jgi:hypothetical protein